MSLDGLILESDRPRFLGRVLVIGVMLLGETDGIIVS